MKLANVGGRAALVFGDEIADVATASEGRFGSDLASIYDDWDAFRAFAATVPAPSGPLVAAELGCPVPSPRQVFAIGLNYRAHAEESGMAVPEVPAVFTKFPACLAGPFDEIEIHGPSIDWEVELVAVIGATADRVDGADGWAHVAGLTVGQDISDRVLQFAAGPHFSLGKSRRGYGPMGPWVVTPDELSDPTASPSAVRSTARRCRTLAPTTSSSAFPGSSPNCPPSYPCSPATSSSPARPPASASPASPPRTLQPGNVLETWVEGIGTIRNACV